MKTSIKIVILFLLINLLGCGKSLIEQFGFVETRIQGKWEMVNYEINSIDLIDKGKFYFKKIKIDKVRINYQNELKAFPENCELCPNDAQFSSNISYDNSNNANINLPNNYIGGGNIDSLTPTTNEKINIFYYNSTLDTVKPFAVYGYYWQIEKLTSKMLILNNSSGFFNTDNIKMTFEKY